MRRPAGATAVRAVTALVAACLLGATTAALVLTHRPPGRRPAGPERVVVLGDSVATGTGCDCRPFGPRLGTLLARRLHRPVRVATLAKDGLTTADLLQQVRTDTTTQDALRGAAAVTVTIAANDFDADDASGCASDGEAAACYDDALSALPSLATQLLRTLRARTGARTRILVTGYWNVFLDGAVGASQSRAYQVTSDALTRRVNAALQSAATAVGATYVDLYGAFRGTGATDDTDLLAPDGDHPSDSGQERIAQVLAGVLTQPSTTAGG